MPDFNDFRNGVFSLYDLRKAQNQLDPRLANPTPASLRKYCLIRLCQNLPKTDIEFLKDFFDPLNKSTNFEKTIDEYPLGKLRALQKLILARTEDPNESLIKLLAILVDYQPRPFCYSYDNKILNIQKDSPRIDESFEIENDIKDVMADPNEFQVDDSVIVSEKNQVETSITTDGGKDKLVTIEENNKDKEEKNIEDPVHSREKLHFNKYALRFAGIASMVIAIFFAVNYFTPEDCMCWNGKEYIQVDCQDKTQRYQIIGLDKEKLEGFKKITKLDTLKEEDIDHIWYSKIDNEVEFFTAPGRHPTQTNKALKAVTKYIWDTRLKGKSENVQYKQLGIIGKQ
ncbi:hypothetical protein [Sphingobacterium sp.]|uniref:hypothetical protein n=1 Tax=Sphingobacterium sp. TaxID=341027 RepID=UPI002588F01A|nr:hypothetical protein [Sphingobacterium sp.]WET69796.1 MAG: hypothetical protein P0Y57_01645 [Sphingobacterium sp.]